MPEAIGFAPMMVIIILILAVVYGIRRRTHEAYCICKDCAHWRSVRRIVSRRKQLD